jgi:hypothetical protein
MQKSPLQEDRRTRLRHAWGRFVGPEARPIDHLLTVATTGIGTVAAAVTARRRGGGPAASTGSAILAADLVGGAYVNNTLASARWYERPGQGDREHLIFAVCHVHPGVVAWMDRASPGRLPGPLWASAHYIYLLSATVAIRRLPRFRRPLGVTLTAGGILLDQVLGRSRLVPWFAWSYYPKLLMGHAAASLWSTRCLAEQRCSLARD